MRHMAALAHSRVVAVLGPTNTGKTHLAIERMLGHASGMIGFPLRLLARENYDRIVRLRGRNAVALVTGEEKIVPPNPRYFVCTVRSMPLDRPVEFLAIDEVQLAADPERGMSSPRASSMPAASPRRCCSARTRCAPSSAASCRRRSSSSGRASRPCPMSASAR